MIILHVLVAIALILTVLLQTGKGAGIGAAFGSGSSSTVFGSRGPASFMSKLTAISAIVFMLTSLTLSIMAGNRIGGNSVMDSVNTPPVTQQQAPEGSSATAEPGKDVPADSAATQSTTEEATPPAAEPQIPKEEAKPIAPDASGNSGGTGSAPATN